MALVSAVPLPPGRGGNRLPYAGRFVWVRRTAQAAGLTVWGTLKVLLEAKKQGLTERIEPLVQGLVDAGLWVSSGIQRRILDLAGEP